MVLSEDFGLKFFFTVTKKSYPDSLNLNTFYGQMFRTIPITTGLFTNT